MPTEAFFSFFIFVCTEVSAEKQDNRIYNNVQLIVLNVNPPPVPPPRNENIESCFISIEKGLCLSMIIGIGIDTVEIERIRNTIDRFGDRILTKLFTDEEIRNSATGQDPVRQYAVRFAAKEALSKAFATGNTGDFGWKKVEVLFSPAGVPSFRLSSLTGLLLEGSTVYLSASATDKEVVATVVIAGKH